MVASPLHRPAAYQKLAQELLGISEKGCVQTTQKSRVDRGAGCGDGYTDIPSRELRRRSHTHRGAELVCLRDRQLTARSRLAYTCSCATVAHGAERADMLGSAGGPASTASSTGASDGASAGASGGASAGASRSTGTSAFATTATSTSQ